jgi:hypothetical protein
MGGLLFAEEARLELLRYAGARSATLNTMRSPRARGAISPARR